MSRSEIETLTDNLFPVCLESLLDSLSRFVRKLLRDGFRQFIRMLVGRIPQKSDLLPITAAPFTEQEMNTQAESLAQRELVVECLRLQTGRRLATRRKVAQPSGKGFRGVSNPIHCSFRQRTTDIRTGCTVEPVLHGLSQYKFVGGAPKSLRIISSRHILFCKPIRLQATAQSHAGAMQHHP